MWYFGYTAVNQPVSKSQLSTESWMTCDKAEHIIMDQIIQDLGTQIKVFSLFLSAMKRPRAPLTGEVMHRIRSKRSLFGDSMVWLRTVREKQLETWSTLVKDDGSWTGLKKKVNRRGNHQEMVTDYIGRGKGEGMTPQFIHGIHGLWGCSESWNPLRAHGRKNRTETLSYR